ncbi:MAG TPA: hypothetical protein VGO11_08655, partial [Chthoniobacteraceae bacterium]|nr:hypothetical protein [Chthoniobacteraceae bacterium]
MKSFLDRFRRKDGDEPEPSEAKAAEAPAKTDKPAPSKSAAPKFAPPAKSTVRPEAKPAAAAPAETEAKPAADEPLVLELGDFLHRIPAGMLKEGPHDLHTPLQFDLDGVASRVARGETTVPLKELHRQVPHIFRDDALIPPDQEVRFPWQKVLKLLGESNAAQAQGLGGETLAQKLHKRRVVRNIGSGRAASAVEGSPAEGGKAAPVLRGTGTRGQTGSWFTRTAPVGVGAVAPEPARAPEPAAKAPEPEPAPAPVAETPAPPPMRSLKLTLPPDPAEKAAAAKPAPAPAVPDAPAPSVPFTEGADADPAQLLKARDAALGQLARAKADFERQLNSVTQERQTALEARDTAMLELEALRRGVAEQQEQAEFQKSVAEKAAEKVAQASREREELEAGIAALKAERAALQEKADAAAQDDAPLEHLATGKEAVPRSQKEYQRT